MKNCNSLFALFTLLYLCVFIVSCKSKKDTCNVLICENGGVCVEETCACPANYGGLRCQYFEPPNIDSFLDNGYTPKQLIAKGVPIDSFYGKNYGGGILFYLSQNGDTGYVVQSQDLSIDAQWGCFNTEVVGANGYLFGDGERNTSEIIAGCTTTGIAARLCNDLVLNGRSDWFLPSRDELYEVYYKVVLKGYGNFDFSNGRTYWNSTQSGDRYAGFLYLDQGSFGVQYKNTPDIKVRAIRTFYN